MPHFYHVTPLFHLPNIVDQSGLVCGGDVEGGGLPRRETSREFDDMPLGGLDGKRVADCVLLYLRRKPMNNLLLSKICGTRQSGAVWRCYPHVVLRFDSDKCLSLLKNPVWGASTNVGRSLRNGKEPSFRHYENTDTMMEDRVQEILILAEELPGRSLPLSCLDSIEVFSPSDQQLVQSLLNGTTHDGIQAVMSNAQQRVEDYTAGQSFEPGKQHLRMYKDLFAAIQNKNEALRQKLVERLSRECFD